MRAARIRVLTAVLAVGSGLPVLHADQVKDVKVVNTPNVNIDAVREPFQMELRFDTPDGFSEFTAEFEVPAGKRLVLEQVSGVSTPPFGQTIRYFSLRTTVAGEFAFHTIPVTFNGFVDWVGCQQVRLYADPGTLVKLSAPRAGGSAGAFQTVATISGYFVTVP
jgi:hypothetical protein